MLQRSISFLAMTALLLHSIFGCCWHHAHADAHAIGANEAGPNHNDSQHVVPCAHHCHVSLDSDAEQLGHAAHHRDSNSPEPHAPCQQDPCDGDVCHFALPLHVKVPSPGESAFTHAAQTTAAVALSCAGQADCYGPGAVSAHASTCCCARTMTQVWLL
jgi:hypothetical protein